MSCYLFDNMQIGNLYSYSTKMWTFYTRSQTCNSNIGLTQWNASVLNRWRSPVRTAAADRKRKRAADKTLGDLERFQLSLQRTPRIMNLFVLCSEWHIGPNLYVLTLSCTKTQFVPTHLCRSPILIWSGCSTSLFAVGFCGVLLGSGRLCLQHWSHTGN